MNPLLHLFLITFAVGAFTFGGGYALIPILKGEFIDQWHWVTPQEFSYGIAVGQITPGPISAVIAFLGWKVAGFPGAVVATIGLYLPAFLSVWLIAKFSTQIRYNPRVQGMLRAIGAVMSAVILNLAFDFGKTVFSGGILPIILAVFSFILLSLTSLNPGWLFISSIILGLILQVH